MLIMPGMVDGSVFYLIPLWIAYILIHFSTSMDCHVTYKINDV